jgi:hypothetical protein
MDEPQAEVLEEGRAARATAPECARRRVSRRHGARGRPVARSLASAGPCMRSDPRAVWGSVWGSLWASAWGSMASERVENSRSARSTPVNTRSVETPTRERARARPRTDRLRLHSIGVWITERDERICIDVFEHRVLTTIQLYELHFPSCPRARKRLLELDMLGLLWRTRPQRPARIPLRSRARMLGSSRLRHLRETSGFFTRLADACRLGEHPCRLGRWLGERTCATLIGAMASVIGSALTCWSPSARSAAP